MSIGSVELELAAIVRPKGRLASPKQRFWTRVEFTDACWLWTGGLNAFGYGSFHVYEEGRNRTIASHRWAWMDQVGQIPDGLELDHLCRVRHCVRPTHLEPVTKRENIQRGRVGEATASRQRAKTHCKHGHERTPENTYVRANGRKWCKVCEYRRRHANRS